MSYDEARISELENKIAAICISCPQSKWLIGGFQCTVGRRHCHSRKVRRWLDEIKRSGGAEVLKRAKEIGVCPRCGQPLVELSWSKSVGRRVYILTCDNLDCTDYRNPVKTIAKEVME
ncbi:unnamed protein product [marine sediment metagenome]|uniref:Uncharacterized protein n=1 Tax=marine sediment metagenome TaxID=412755 RepID=X1TBJ4_9ZZZZ